MEQIRFRDPGWKKFESGINIPDPQHRFLLKVFFHESSSPKPLKITLGSFAAGVNDTGGNLPPVSTTPAANWPQIMGTLSD
jgi:hypothetical protein